MELGEGGLGVGGVDEGLHRVEPVEAGVGEVEVVVVAVLEPGPVSESRFSAAPCRFGEVEFEDVDAGHV